MTCPWCSREGSGVVRSIDDGLCVKRVRQCVGDDCKRKFTCTESVDQAVYAAISSHKKLLAARNPPDLARICNPPAPNSVGGVGGDLSSDRSDSGPQTGSSLSNPGDPQYHEPPPRRVKPITPPAYPAEFELAWAACDKVGTKADALKAWEQVGRPAADVLAKSWAAWKRVAWVDGIGLQHVATWLRAFNFRETPGPRPKTGGSPPGAAPSAPSNPYCPWHLDALRYRLPANKPLATCPACKHLTAASLKRTGEPQSLADIGDRRG